MVCKFSVTQEACLRGTRKPLKWFPQFSSFCDPNLKVGENERFDMRGTNPCGNLVRQARGPKLQAIKATSLPLLDCAILVS
jgi:hypothetical protein